ncbi:PDDEXK nuclease domain-containing protein [Sphingobacterium detergens]|uniref:Putative nuclease of restriction endonuclease-like (RecB) superfamily n=1 Tax=Sphingobacterium detergens TaxID=1145106 RepID=A0A420ABD4_SPHD1|nr:PDDEXK nuclease domain-containing protein [Sphingobacterium detergens]RKE41766.1 putative nuclease of restriction endonuclease-like (RecB) superfamily [Sphingobacterium detergens]
MDKRFTDIIQLIQQSRNNAIKAVNVELINLYWNIGAYVKQKLSVAEWGDKTVNELADFIRKNNPELKGFSRAGLYRMVQFYETYAQTKFVASSVRQMQVSENKLDEIVAPAVRQFRPQDIKNTLLAELSWTHHLTIFSRCKTEEEREFYLRMVIKEKYTKRELSRQISASLFERVMIGNTKLSTLRRELNTDIVNPFKDSYVFEFLNLSEPHSESDLQKGLIKQMKNFILELGRDFIFIDEEYKVQVGNRDFYIDLLFYHRDLQCLIAFELKTDEFQPDHLGQINFYLEALDRDVRKPHENPSIGILLCKGKDSEVVEYALNRSLSPTMVSEYQTQLPDKKLLQQKLHEIFENSNAEDI